MRDIPLVKLNDFAKAYGAFTFESGTLRLATEMNAKNGSFRGYVEPVFDHMGLFNPDTMREIRSTQPGKQSWAG